MKLKKLERLVRIMEDYDSTNELSSRVELGIKIDDFSENASDGEIDEAIKEYMKSKRERENASVG